MVRTRLATQRRRTCMRRAADGLRRSWRRVEDLRDPAVLAEIERACRAIAADVNGEAEINAWLEAVRDTNDWTP